MRLRFSIIVGLATLASTASAERRLIEPTPQKCSRVLAAGVMFREIRIVGLVEDDHRRAILILAPRNARALVHAGECVGLEHIPFEWLRNRVAPPVNDAPRSVRDVASISAVAP